MGVRGWNRIRLVGFNVYDAKPSVSLSLSLPLLVLLQGAKRGREEERLGLGRRKGREEERKREESCIRGEVLGQTRRDAVTKPIQVQSKSGKKGKKEASPPPLPPSFSSKRALCGSVTGCACVCVCVRLPKRRGKCTSVVVQLLQEGGE